MSKARVFWLIVALSLFSVICQAGDDFEEFAKAFDAQQHGDNETAFKKYRVLAERGYAPAQYNLGVMYQKGVGVPQNFSAAAKWVRKAAEQGVRKAQFKIAAFYAGGIGVTQDYAEAVNWGRKAAMQGDSEAQGFVGIAYGTGLGVPQDFVESYAWCNISAAQGVEASVKPRDAVVRIMTASQREKAQELSKEYYKKYVLPFK